MQEIYHQTILNAPLAVFLSTEEGTVIEANYAAAKLFGYNLEEIKGMHRSSFIDETMPGFAEMYEQRARTGAIHAKFIGIKKNGDRFPVQMSSQLFTTHTGERRASAIIADISESESQAETNRQLMNEMQLILSNTDESFIILDNQLNVVAMNASASIRNEAILGRNMEVGTPVLSYASAEMLPALKQLYNDVLAGHSHRTIVAKHHNGEKIYYQNTYKPIKNDAGEVKHIMINTIDITLQKNIENQLQELLYNSEQQKNTFEKERNYFVNSLEQLLDGFVTINASGNATFINSNAKRLLHISENLQHPNVINAIPESERALFAQVVQNAIDLQQSNVLELYHASWNEWIRYRIYPNMGEITIFFRSITQDVKNRQAIENSEKLYRNLFHYNPQPMWIIDFETKRFLEVNETAIQKYGYSKEEFMNMTVYDLLTQFEAEALQQQWQKTENLDVYFGKWQHVTKLGNVIDVEITARKINYNQQPASLILINDITDQIRTSKLLEQSNQRFEYVSEVSFNAIWDWDILSGNMYWGNGYTEMFGYVLDNNKGSIDLWKSRIHQKDAQRVTESLQKAIADGADFWEASYYYKKADGTWAYVLDRGKILKDENGKPYRMVGAMQDETFNKYNQSIQEIENIIYNLNLQQKVSFKDIIDVLLIELEKIHPNMLASVLTLQADNTVQHLSAPHLPEGYLQVIDGMAIGPSAGSCGTAMYTKEMVIVENIEEDYRWKLYKHIALQYHLKSCWSIPIFNKQNIVLGSLAFYYTEPKKPSQLQLQTLERMSRLIGIVMENHYNYLLLATNKLRYELIAQATSDALWDWNIENDTVELLGDGFEKLFGYPSAVLQREKDFWRGHIHPEDLPDLLVRENAAFKNTKQNIWEAEYRFKKSNGQYAYVRDKGFIIREEDGRVLRMIGATEDITLRKMNEEELKRLSMVAKETTNAVIITDAQENITYVNEAFTKITGYTLNECLGKNPRFLQGAASDVTTIAYMRQQINAQQPFECEILNYTKQGTPIWLHIEAQPIFNEHKQLIQYFAIETDITEAQKTREALRLEEEKYKHLFNTNPASIFIWDMNTLQILDMNDTAIIEYGYSRKELLKMTILQLRPQSEYNTLQQFVNEFKNSEKKKHVQIWQHVKKNGELMQMEIASHKITYEGKECVMGIGTNITERLALEAKLAEEQAQRHNQVIEAEITAQENERQEIGRELHDNVNQILTASRIYVEMARKAHPEEDELLQQSSWYIIQAIEEIRKLSKALINPVDKDVSLKEAIRKLVANMSLLLNEGVEIDLSHFNETNLEEKFRLNLYRIIQEQLTNISKHAEATQVKIQLRRTTKLIALRIEDNGKGFHVHQVKSGIGLNNIRKRTEMYKGRFEIESEPGKGTILKVDFFNG